MDRASDAPVVASAGTQAEPRTPASWLLSAGRFQTAAPLPVGSDPRSVPRTEPVHIAPLPSSPALGRYAKGLPAAVILLRRNRTDRPLNEGFLLRRLQPSVPPRNGTGKPGLERYRNDSRPCDATDRGRLPGQSLSRGTCGAPGRRATPPVTAVSPSYRREPKRYCCDATRAGGEAVDRSNANAAVRHCFCCRFSQRAPL